MIVDTSAIMAIALNEPERNRFFQAIVDASDPAMSAGSWIELGVVLSRRSEPEKTRLIEQFVRDAGIRIEPVTVEQADYGRQAYREFGKGNHPARLNFGDCFAYALSKATGEPLLFKGDDFARTDVVAA
jgi:ribonuclease VapC